MQSLCVFILLIFCVNDVFPQGLGSGNDGNLRLCVVEARGSYKRASRFCPVLDEQKSNVECVIGTDRLDCLRRMGKGKVDFGVFNPEDLMAAQWANIDVLVTNELRIRPRPFERSIVAVVNRRLLPEGTSTIQAVLRGSTLCHPGHSDDDRHPLSDTLAEYLESLLTERSCNVSMSLQENRIKSMAEFFGQACKAGSWVPDPARDAELKDRYRSLCAACGNPKCTLDDRYWGASGALLCLAEAAGDVTWAELDNVETYFGTTPDSKHYADPDLFAYLCRDGTWQPLKNNPEPCVWINKPWPVIVAKRKAVEDVMKMADFLTNSSAVVQTNWHGAMTALLEATQALPEPLQPPLTPLDYLAKARGFREAYSQAGCDPPRHITFCTTSLLEKNKCEWLGEASAVYGVSPPLQCEHRANSEECMRAVQRKECDVTVADSDYLIRGLRNYSVVPILHEATPIVEKLNTVVAYTREDSGIKDLDHLRRKRVVFPRFDGLAWHAVLNYLMKKENMACSKLLSGYFTEICAPGIEKYNVSQTVIEKLTRNCNKLGYQVLDGEKEALHSIVSGKADVAFISMGTYNMYKAQLIQEPWANAMTKVVPICPKDNKQFCFISWSNIGHIYASNSLTPMRRQEIVNVFTHLDQLFGKYYPFHNAMFSMYGPFNHQVDILFHNNTRVLASDAMLKMHPYDRIPFNFETDLTKVLSDSCQISDLVHLLNFAAKILPPYWLLIVSLVVYLSS